MKINVEIHLTYVIINDNMYLCDGWATKSAVNKAIKQFKIDNNITSRLTIKYI